MAETDTGFLSIHSCERSSLCGPNSRKELVWHAWRSCLFKNVNLSYLPLLSESLQMDNKGWNGQKASFTEATSNSEYLHVSLCLYPFPSPPPLRLSIPPSIPQVVLAIEMARRLISVTGQWAADCQLNRPCVLVGSLRIQAHSHRLTGQAHWGPPGSPPTAFLCRKK